MSWRLLLDVGPVAGRLLLALCQADESRVNVGICSLKLTHRADTDRIRRRPHDPLIANQHEHRLCNSRRVTQERACTRGRARAETSDQRSHFHFFLILTFGLVCAATADKEPETNGNMSPSGLGFGSWLGFYNLMTKHLKTFYYTAFLSVYKKLGSFFGPIFVHQRK